MRWRLRLRPRNWRLLLLTLLLLAAAVFLLQVAVSGFLEALSLREGQRNPRCDGPAIYCNPELRGEHCVTAERDRKGASKRRTLLSQ